MIRPTLLQILQQVLLYTTLSFFVVTARTKTTCYAQQQEVQLLCRCSASFENFYSRHLLQEDDFDARNGITSTRTLSMSMKKADKQRSYPYEYSDTYVDDEGYYVVEGIRVLPTSDPVCSNGDDDETRHGRRTKKERYDDEVKSTSARLRNLGMMMMWNKGIMSSSDGSGRKSGKGKGYYKCGPRDTSPECLPDIIPCPKAMEPPTDIPTSSPMENLPGCTNDDDCIVICPTDGSFTDDCRPECPNDGSTPPSNCARICAGSILDKILGCNDKCCPVAPSKTPSNF